MKPEEKLKQDGQTMLCEKEYASFAVENQDVLRRLLKDLVTGTACHQKGKEDGGLILTGVAGVYETFENLIRYGKNLNQTNK